MMDIEHFGSFTKGALTAFVLVCIVVGFALAVGPR